MAREYCMSGEYPEDFRYCPKCGEYLLVARGLKNLQIKAEQRIKEARLASIPRDYLDDKFILDENGNPMIFERQ